VLFFFSALSAGYRPRQLQPSLNVRFQRKTVELGQIGEIKKNSAWLCAYKQKTDWLRPAALEWQIALTTFDGWR